MIDFVLPSLGADMDQAMLVAWLVEPGEEVAYGQIIAEVETDKGVIEVECWHDGVVEEFLVEPGPTKLAVGTSLARIRPIEEVPPSEGPTLASATPSGPLQQRAPTAPKPPTPPIRHLAHTLGVDIEHLAGTGTGGAVTRDDVRKAARPKSPASSPAPDRDVGRRVKASPRARALANAQGVALEAITPSRADGLVVYSDVAGRHVEVGDPEDRNAAMRRAITRSMTRSKREIPHYYLATTIDMTRALNWLEDTNAGLPIARRILPAVLLLKATALALDEVPDLNGHWIDERFVRSDAVHLGVAISLRGGGLVAPAIHHADSLELSEMMERLKDLVARARSWRLRGSEMSDPTITVTNLGDRGVETAFPVIIPPQVAMVGFGKVLDAVVPFAGSPSIHPVVHATLAADHRVTDGHTGGLLLSALDRRLQQPEEL